MTLDKLHKNIIAGFGETIWPLYTIFKHRLELRKFEDLKMIHGTHADFKAVVRNDIEQNGLLCPIVIDLKNEIRNGNHRFRAIKKHGDASFFYVAKTREEVNFFSRLRVRTRSPSVQLSKKSLVRFGLCLTATNPSSGLNAIGINPLCF